MRYVIAIVGLVVVLGSLAGLKGAQISSLISKGEEMQKAGAPPEVVSSSKSEQASWDSTLSAVGSVVSVKGVALGNDAPGMVSRIAFESGATVKQGQVLLELDTKVERAQLASILARRRLAEVSLERSRALVQSGAAPQAQLDTDDSALKGLTADIAALQAQIDRKIVRAPFAGRLGIRAVNLGQYLAPGTTVTILESAESTSVDFTLPQQDLAKIREGTEVRILQEGDSKLLAKGTISAIDPALAAATRSVKIRAQVPTQDEKLRPGMFVNVQVVLPEQKPVVAVPVTSVVHAAYGDSIFLVEPKKAAAGAEAGKPGVVARQQFVRLGETRGDFIAVLDGVTAGQEIVTSGAFKLRNGSSLVINNDVKLKAEAAPRPENR